MNPNNAPLGYYSGSLSDAQMQARLVPLAATRIEPVLTPC